MGRQPVLYIAVSVGWYRIDKKDAQFLSKAKKRVIMSLRERGGEMEEEKRWKETNALCVREQRIISSNNSYTTHEAKIQTQEFPYMLNMHHKYIS